MKRKQSGLVRALSPLRDFLHTEAAGGMLLVVAAVVALVWANSPWSGSYDSLWHSVIRIEVAGHALALDLRHWVNDGLMTIFFLVVGLEIKREVTSGHLAGRRAAALPAAAALGGMVIPALLYVAIAGGEAASGWGVPMATDIALAVGVMALAGSGLPASLRAFLLGLAVVDDIGAIVVIAIFYTDRLSVGWLIVAIAALAITIVARQAGVHQLLAYATLGTVMWYALHEAGIHTTLAGVAMGLLAPVVPRVQEEYVDTEELGDVSTVEHAKATVSLAKGSVSVVEWLEHVLHPWSSFLIVPVFALANSGIEVSTDRFRDALGSPITWGVFVGLVVGKPLGVLLATKVATRAGIADPPADTSTRQLLGAGNAAGIGFTVALFIAELAFRTDGVTNEDQVAEAKMAILVASVLSGVLAFAVLRQRATAAPAAADIEAAPTSGE